MTPKTMAPSIQLAELILHMDMVTDKGHRARDLARQVLANGDDALRHLKLIEHATAPYHDDGAYHEAAHDLARAGIVAIESELAADRASRAVRQEAWQPIASAPKTGRTLLLGYFNVRGKWRTLRGQWFSREIIDQEWENAEDCEEGWYETMVEGDEERVWKTEPTHWMPTPKAPTEAPAL